MCRNEKCKTCQYRGAATGMTGCDYYLITGKRRGCSVEKCDKHIKGEKIQLKTTFKSEVVPGWLRNTYKGRNK